MERLTDEQIAEGMKLCAEATPGSWQQNGSHIYGPDPARHLICQMHYIGRGYQEECAANESLIKSGRTLLPAALEELEALRKEPQGVVEVKRIPRRRGLADRCECGNCGYAVATHFVFCAHCGGTLAWK